MWDLRVILEYNGQEISYMRAEWKPKSELLPSLKVETFKIYIQQELDMNYYDPGALFPCPNWNYYCNCTTSVLSSLIKRTIH